MRTKKSRWLVAAVAAVVGVGVTSQALRAGDDFQAGPAKDERFVVHEWGTFTSMQGEDGAVLEGLSREEESLPPFVYSRTKVRNCPLRAKGYKGLEVEPTHVTQKMETPVIYFHSAKARKVRVRVDFMKGLLSQWYPVSDLLGPPENACDDGPLDLAKVDRSFLQWDVEVLAPGAKVPDEVPQVESANPWAFAREVDANWVRTLPRKAPERMGPVEAEKYLFYRGLGSFAAGLSANVAEGGTVTLGNGTGADLEGLVLLEVKGDRARFANVAGVKSGGSTPVQLDPAWGALDLVSKQIQDVVHSRLMCAGLRDDESTAMVRTWARSWFRCEGMRVLWVMPRAKVDAMLPLSIDPAPDELLRVLVGRLELIAPETEREVEAALRDRTSSDGAKLVAAQQRLDRLGRFLEPHVRNVLARTSDPQIRRTGELLLEQMKASGDAK